MQDGVLTTRNRGHGPKERDYWIGEHFLQPAPSLHSRDSRWARRAFPQVFADVNQATTNGNVRHPVLVRSGFTRTSDDNDERAGSSGMFDTEVVRSTDSEGRLAIFVFPEGDHHPYRGAPLHVHHEQDERRHGVREWASVVT